MSDNAHDDAHTGPIKTPKQLLIAVFFAFVIPVFGIVALVHFVGAETKTAPGVSSADQQKSVQARIEKVGTVEIRDANRPLKSGEEVFKAQCSACHTAGVAGAPKFGDKGAWAPRIKNSYEALLNSALKGKGAMGPQGGGDFDDLEIGRAVVYMANEAGAKFAEPQRPGGAAAPAAAASGAASGAAPAASGAASGAPAAAPASAAASK